MNILSTYTSNHSAHESNTPVHATSAPSIPQPRTLHRADLEPGDTVVLTTQNSVYTVRLLDEEMVLVSGGWFDRTGRSPMTTTIEGCTWDGVLYDTTLLAARGMHVRLGEITTSRIKKIYVVGREHAPAVKS